MFFQNENLITVAVFRNHSMAKQAKQCEKLWLKHDSYD